jgi:ubiquitin-protein ligase
MTSARERRLRNTYRAMQELADKCLQIELGGKRVPRFEFTHNGNIAAEEYPDTYGITLRVKGIESLHPFKERFEHEATIYLPVDFPAKAPVVRWHTPISHPNILTFDETNPLYRELSVEFGGEDLLSEDINRDPRWIELLDAYVCLDTLRENWTPFVGLDELVIEMANMVRYRTYNADNPFNKAAAAWAKEKEKLHGYFPLDGGLLEIGESPEIRIVDVRSGV